MSVCLRALRALFKSMSQAPPPSWTLPFPGGARRPGAARRTALALLLLPAGLCGCAHVWVDADGTRHVAGWVHLSLPPADDSGGSGLRVRSLGLSWLRSAEGAALTLGYSDVGVLALRNHSLVRVGAPGLPLSRADTGASDDQGKP
ncbi:hypothetical protein [Azohydromonas australica]|uniref:hypothetical protein n=1 Tax=Azohydromonas australica TaxID=364039 RepID=UPI001B7F925E|nr:hypothetical protein [Azohydromonas australica]